MNRRNFLIKGVLAAVGLTALPAASALAKLPVALGAHQPGVGDFVATEAEAIDDIVDYVKFWDEELPGHDFRELLLRRLVREKTGMSSSEFSHHYWKYAEKAMGTTIQDGWAHHALAISGS